MPLAPSTFATAAPATFDDRRAARQQQMTRGYNAYNGRPKLPLRVRQGEPDDNLLICLGRLIVDKSVSFLWGPDVPAQIGSRAPRGVTVPRVLLTGEEGVGAPSRRGAAAPAAVDGSVAPRQDWLDEYWRRQKRALTWQKFATNGAICGHAFARLLDTKPWPRLVVLDPQTVDVLTNPDDIDEVWRYTIAPPPVQMEEGADPIQKRTVIQLEGAGQVIRVAGLLGGRDERWSIIDQVERSGEWLTVATQAWPYPFDPIVHCQNLPRPNDFWGESDLPPDVLHILDSLNRIASHYSKIIRLHAHPKIWARGLGARSLDVAIDTVINLPSESAELKVLEMQSDLRSTMALIDRLLNLLSMMVRIPLVALGQNDHLGPISGVALQIRYQPLIEKTELKRRTYGDAAIETDRRLLAMAGFGDTTITTLDWPDIMPGDPLEQRQVAVLDDSLGLASLETLSEQFDYDYSKEQAQIRREKTAAAALHLTLVPPAPPAPPPAPGASPAAAAPRGRVPPPAAPQAPAPDVAQ